MQWFDWNYLFNSVPKLIPPFFQVTLLCVITTLIIGSVFGFLLALCKLGKSRLLRGFAYSITDIIRSMPFLVMLFLLYYGLGKFFPKLNAINKIYFLELTLIIFASCRLSEIMRSAYEAIDKSQMEAALSVGLSASQALTRIVIPQAAYIALPNLGNLLVGMVLETALGFTIGIYDVMGTAKLINAREYGAHNLEIYLAAALIYWVVSLIIAALTGGLEKMHKKDRRRKQVGQSCSRKGEAA
ncbi:MAG: putative amino-acid permease protein YxeN [Firmicutes bacterium ADurb.Bin356]|nr:MAG: putative amino-acid permease protein YxeN [Firmicutes bacterium ADurb.Bin356]